MEIARQHVVIAGAGIIGLAIALELIHAGYRITVVERGRAMEQASWAAAGMLAVEDPENAPELLALSRLSRALYPKFLAKVQGLSGVTVPWRTHHTLQGTHASVDFLQMNAAPAELPTLRTERYNFTLLEEVSLDPRDLCMALPRAAIAAGVTLREGATVTAVSQMDGGLEVHLSAEDDPRRYLEQRLEADHFILACGAWSGQPSLLGMPALPIAPRKGQMIEVTLDGTALPLVIRTPELYLVPRSDGRVVIGATVEHAGFDRSTDQAASERLWQAAASLWPPVLAGRITAQWTGLRPGFVEEVHDALPVIGRLQGNVWAATAHFRNGILLAPGTALLLREMLCQETPSVGLAAFSPQRFMFASSHAWNS